MNKSAFPINPWLAEKVQEYRKQNKDSKLRADYDISVQAGSKLSWDQHLTVRALQSALKWDSFLQTIRWKMDLPEEIIFAAGSSVTASAVLEMISTLPFG